MERLTEWRLRELLAQRELYQTTELVPLLAAQGVVLSREQVYRLVTTTPRRLNIEVLGALCTILECSPNDLIGFKEQDQAKKVSNGDAQPIGRLVTPPAKRTVIRRPYAE